MIKRLAIIIAVLLVLPSHAFAASRIVTVQSMTIQPYEEVVRGFSSVCPEKRTRIVLSEIPPDSYPQTVKELSPELLLAVGLSALDTAISTDHPPVVYTMVLPQDIPGPDRGENITGVLMQVSAETQLKNIVKVLPKVTQIGLLFDPKQSSKMVEDARLASRRMGIELLAEAVVTPKEIAATLLRIKSQAEVIWMLPDITVSRPQTLELFTLFSFENRIPLVIYSDKYLEKGAFMSIGVDLFDMGRQAGDMANAILAGSDWASLPPREASTAVITINKTIADKFAIEIDEATADMAKVVGRD